MSTLEIQRQHNLFASNEVLRDVLDAVPTASAVLNCSRQIVLGNIAAAAMAGLKDKDALLGQRPGEALNCVYADDGPDGCGTTEFCSTCGSAIAITLGEAGIANAQECRLTKKTANGGKESVELMVSVKPITVGGETFLNCTMTDVSHERRRRALERTFFHDLKNCAAGLMLSVGGLENSPSPREIAESAELVRTCTEQLLSEIKCHENLLAAESGDLKLVPAWFSTLDMITLFIEQYEPQFAQKECTLTVSPHCDDICVRSDQTLLSRILGNMLKNALEASTVGSVVTLGCNNLGDTFELWVQNPQYMSEDVQHQVFQRSFSTKGPNRGLGTYGMRLLSERYLRGSLRFTSQREEGTKFIGRYPIDLGRPK